MTRTPSIVRSENISRADFVAAILSRHARDPATGRSRAVSVSVAELASSAFEEVVTVLYRDGRSRDFRCLAHPTEPPNVLRARDARRKQAAER